MLFTHIRSGESDAVRNGAMQFLAIKMRELDKKVFTKEIEDYIYEEAKKVHILHLYR